MPLPGFPHGYSIAATPFARLLAVVAPALERLLLERRYARVAIDRPIFIVGAFRSGTTVLEQIIAQHPGVGYFWFLTNACSQFPVTGYGVMRLGQALGVLDRESKPFIHNPRLAFTIFSPYECEAVWAHSKKSLWDERCADLTIEADFSDPLFERYLFDLIRRHLGVQRATRFLNKNPINSLRTGYLHRLFPDARFVFIVRDPLDTILSHHRIAAHIERVVYSDVKTARIFEEGLRMIVLTQRIKTRTYAQTLALNRLHPLLGIANQWKDLQAAVLESMAHAPGLADRVLLLRYEELVSQPAAILERMWNFVELGDEQAEAITRAWVPRLTPPPPIEPTAEERSFLPRAQEIIAPVAAQLGYVVRDA